MNLQLLRRIERALRAENLYLPEEVELKKTEPGALTNTLEDRQEIHKVYKELRGEHSFSDSIRIARLAWLCSLFNMEFDLEQEKDIPVLRKNDPYIDKEDA